MTARYDAAVFDKDWERAAKTDVLDWAEAIRADSIELSEKEIWVLQDPKGWASRVLDACER